jgi:two-component system, sensor histidine kinase and response regulator
MRKAGVFFPLVQWYIDSIETGFSIMTGTADHILNLTPGPRILVVDDDPFVRAMLSEILTDAGYGVETARNGRDALDRFLEPPPVDLILSDMNMATMDGIQLVRRVREHDADLPVLILTVNNRVNVALEAIGSGANDYLLKDENIAETILVRLDKALQKQRLEAENRRLMADLIEKNEALSAANAELTELNQLKNKFLGIAAHDLRSPIANIIGLSDIILGYLDAGTADLGQDTKLRTIHTLADNMLGLIDELLDVSIIESGRLELKLRPVNLRPLLVESIRLNRAMADKKGIDLSIDLESVPDALLDPPRIIQAFENYLNNAVKYSPPGTTITISLTADAEGVRVGVTDEGPGISESDQARLFTAFEKLDTKPTGGEPSTGLGLAIVRKVIEAHGGTVFVHSRPGAGSTFGFVLPIEPADGAADG